MVANATKVGFPDKDLFSTINFKVPTAEKKVPTAEKSECSSVVARTISSTFTQKDNPPSKEAEEKMQVQWAVYRSLDTPPNARRSGEYSHPREKGDSSIVADQLASRLTNLHPFSGLDTPCEMSLEATPSGEEEKQEGNFLPEGAEAKLSAKRQGPKPLKYRNVKMSAMHKRLKLLKYSNAKMSAMHRGAKLLKYSNAKVITYTRQRRRELLGKE